MATDPTPDWAALAAHALTTGGDRRILVDPVTGLNQYFASPAPSAMLAYASSTANDISAPAFAHVAGVLAGLGGGLGAHGYAAGLATLRARLRAAYAVDPSTEIVFAPSGTDLEYLGLALAAGRAPGGIVNVLLGADEVGSGCIHSARGRYFADVTARGVAVTAEAPVGPIAASLDLVHIPVRHAGGAALTPQEIAARIDAAVTAATAAGRHALVHVVHGSKTGLVLPALAELDALIARHGDTVTVVVDACQARITSAAVAAYLKRGASVFLTGSKFMGGPPFSGFALVPAARVRAAAPLPAGFGAIFRRAEWPAAWPGVETLADEPSLGLLLRLEAAVFELERFQALPLAQVSRVILAFHAAVRSAFVDTLGGRRVAPYAPGLRAEGDAQPIEMRTLSTIDLTRLPGSPDFDASKHLHAALVGKGIRLGQPVKCLQLPSGRWAGTLRVGLSMPQVTALAGADDAALAGQFGSDMDRVAAALATLTETV